MAAARPPQDEEVFLMPSIFYLILRSARRARLEGRMESMQRLNRVSFEFMHTLFCG
jgi:hypothetical protein